MKVFKSKGGLRLHEKAKHAKQNKPKCKIELPCFSFGRIFLSFLGQETVKWPLQSSSRTATCCPSTKQGENSTLS